MPVSAGDINDVIALLTTVTVIVAGWMKWGRHWLSKRREERRAILHAANTIPKLAETQEANGLKLQALQTRDLHFHGEFKSLHDRLDSQDSTLLEIRDRIAGAWDSDPVPQFVCGLDGRNMDVNQAYADMLGVDPSMIVADDKVAVIRQERAQQAQAQQMMEGMPAMAQTAKAASDINLSEDNALSSILGMFQGYNSPSVL